MSWSEKYKRSIDCDNPKGFSQKAHCQGKRKKLKEQLKSFRTVEQIAKKHRLDVSFVQKQLDMGEPIEHEHTKDHDLARKIALQHLDEIPDYYTRLKKMEAAAKKQHKKFKDVKENITIENSDGTTFAEIIDLVKPDPIKKEVKEDLRKWFDPNHPEGGWKRYNTKGEAIGPCAREPGEPKPKCLSNKKASQLRSQGGAKKIASAVKRKRREDPVANRRGKGGKPKMVSNKINEDSHSEEVRYCKICGKYETQKQCSYGPEMWIKFTRPEFNIPTENQMKYNPNRPHPANEERDHEYSMARSELSTIIKAAKRLRKKMAKGEGNIEAWVQSKITKAADYIDAAADYVDSGEMSEEVKQLDELWGKLALAAGAAAAPYLMKKLLGPKVDKAINNARKTSSIGGDRRSQQMEEYIEEKNVPTKPSLWSRAKSLAKQKFDVYPSAYANGWASKWYKEHGGGWKSVNEACWDGYTQVGMKKKGKKMVPNCVPTKEEISFEIGSGHRQAQKQAKIRNLATGTTNKGEKEAALRKLTGPSLPLADSYSNWREELGLNEDWQKVNRQDKTDGLSQAAVDAYRRENPGSKLQTAVTEKEPKGKRAKRRENFCRRMKGMKSKLTSAKTAKDPDSRINKALRRWRCR